MVNLYVVTLYNSFEVEIGVPNLYIVGHHATWWHLAWQDRFGVEEMARTTTFCCRRCSKHSLYPYVGLKFTDFLTI